VLRNFTNCSAELGKICCGKMGALIIGFCQAYRSCWLWQFLPMVVQVQVEWSSRLDYNVPLLNEYNWTNEPMHNQWSTSILQWCQALVYCNQRPWCPYHPRPWPCCTWPSPCILVHRLSLLNGFTFVSVFFRFQFSKSFFSSVIFSSLIIIITQLFIRRRNTSRKSLQGRHVLTPILSITGLFLGESASLSSFFFSFSFS